MQCVTVNYGFSCSRNVLAPDLIIVLCDIFNSFCLYHSTLLAWH